MDTTTINHDELLTIENVRNDLRGIEGILLGLAERQSVSENDPWIFMMLGKQIEQSSKMLNTCIDSYFDKRHAEKECIGKRNIGSNLEVIHECPSK